MRLFAVIWSGQFFSLLGTYMSAFALTIWAWQTTGQATALALVALFTFAPTILMEPIAGVLVDRWNRKLVMMISDVASGISTVAIFVLLTSGSLQVWHLYVAGAFTGLFQAFQWPAYSAAMTLIVPKESYGRASGFLSIADSVSNICAPLAAGFLITFIGVHGILTIDIVSFLTAVGILLAVRIPSPPRTEGKRNSVLRDAAFGFGYIFERKGLLGLQSVFFASNLIGSLSYTVAAAMILSRSGNDTLVLGTVQSALGFGGLAGGLIMGFWGGPKKRVDGVLLGGVASSLLGVTVLGLGREPLVWMAGAFATMFFVPICNGCSQAIWQSKVPPELQGRVFGTRALFAQVSSPIAMAIAGPLSDTVMTPGMLPGGSLVPAFGWLVGSGAGAGMALLFVFSGVVGAAIYLTGYAYKPLRRVEAEIPDHDAAQSCRTEALA